MMKKTAAFLFASLAWLALSPVAQSQAAWTFSDAGFFTETVATLPAFSPVGLAWAPDGRMFIATKEGRVRVVKNGVLLSTPFIDIASKVNIDTDRGLLGIAIDPNYAANGYVYLLYVYEHTGNPSSTGARVSLLTRVTSDPANRDRALAGSEVVILGSTAQIPCPSPAPSVNCIPADNDSHAIGSVRFGPDGKLYVGNGDGASPYFTDPLSMRAQDLNSYAGKILRINPDGSAPSDNPFYDGTNSARSRVWAYGLRNPYRFSLHPLTGAVFAGDVGWVTWEEIDKVERGRNYGWPCYEGVGTQPQYQANFSLCQNLSATQVAEPLYAYFHDASGGSAAIGGAFYQGSQYPAQYVLNYFFADYSARWVRRMVFDANGNLQNVLPFAANTGTSDGGLVSLELGPDGYLYYVEITTGIIGRVRHTSGGGANQAPVATAAANPSNGYAPLSVNFSSSGSFDPEGYALSYLWNFGDGTTSTQANPTHVYSAGGVATYTVSLTVTDNQGVSGNAQTTVTVGSTAPAVSISAPVNGAQISPGDTITFSGAATDAEDGALPASALRWTILIHHNTHVHILNQLSGTGGSVVIENHDPAGAYSYEFVLEATDSSGLSTKRSVLLPLLNPLGGPVAAWGMNEGAGASTQDLTGNGHDGTLLNGPVWAAGHYGGALVFDGINDQVSVANGNEINLGTQDFTIMAWVKRQQLGGVQRHILSKCDPINWANGCKELYFTPADALSFGSHATGDTVAATIADTNWHHIAVTFVDSSNTLQIYVDGTLRANATKALESDGANHVLALGNMHGDNTFSGTIDEVRVYGRVLTAGEILADMNTPIVFSGDVAPPVLSNGQPAGSLAAGTTQATLSLSTDEDATCRYGNSAGVPYGAMTSTFDTTGSTTHSELLTGLANGGSYSYYVRCQDEAGNATASDFVIAFSILDNAVSEPPSVSMSAPAAGAVVSGSVSVSANASDNVGVAGVQFLLDGANYGAEDTLAPYSAQWDTTTATNGSHSLSARARDGAGNQSTAAAISVTVSNTAPSAGPVASYALEEASGSTTADNSGNGHSGSLVNGPVWSVGRYGIGLAFDGVNDTLSVANPAGFNLGSADFTVMAWVKRQAIGGAQRHILSKCSANGWVSGCKEFYFMPDNRLTFGSYATGDTASVTITDTNWHHVAASFNDASNTLSIYVDGVLRTTATKALEADGAGHVVDIGNLRGNNAFSGLIDEVRIYNRVLSVTEVLADLGTPVSASADGQPPVVSGGQPSGVLPAGTTQAALSVVTNENAVCRYANVANASYASMPGTFSTTGGGTHSTQLTGLLNGQAYTYYVRCQDSYGNVNASDYVVSFSVAPGDISAPVLSGGQPSGVLPVGTVQVALSVTTNESATCKFGTSAGVAYASIAQTFATTGGSTHASTLTGLVGGQNYTYYLRCQDGAGNANGSDFVVSFSVAADTLAPSVSISAPVDGASVNGTLTLSANASDNVAVTAVQFYLDGAPLGAEDSTAPFSVTWDSSTVADGPHTLRARARDSAGNQGQSAQVSVTVSNSPLTNGLALAFGLNESGGLSAIDASGNGHTGTLVNGPAWGTGWLGGGLVFDGVNDALSVASPATLDLGSADFTFMAWIKRNQLGGGQRHIFSKCSATTWVSGCKELYILPNNRLAFGSYATGDVISAAISDNNWHHVAVTFADSSNSVAIYIDGTLRTAATKALEADGGNHVVTIGNHRGANPFSGTIDEVRFFSRVLSATEISAAMTAPISP